MLYFNHCISDIPTGNNWTISACDGPLDNVYSTSCHNPAVIFYGVNIVNEISRETCTPSSQDGVIATMSMRPSTHTIISMEGKTCLYKLYHIIFIVFVVTQCTSTTTTVTIQQNDLTI